MKEQNSGIKPELNNQSKAKFFAQHLFQAALKWGDIPEPIMLIDPDMVTASEPTSHLLLTSLSDITDQDAIQVAEIALYSPEIEDWDPEEVWIGEGDFDNIGNHSLEVGMRCWTGLININDVSGSITLHHEDCEMQEIYNLTAIIDYLRSKGYALPWMGLSVEDLVNAGWVKLKGEDNGDI